MNLQSTYLGLKLKSPIVVSASTLSEKLDNILLMEDNGAGAVVLFSVFEEQIRQEEARYNAIARATSNTFAEANDYFPDLDDYHVATSAYLELIRQAKEKVEIPIIASLNGVSPEGWIDFASQMEQAGADAIEINVFYIPADIATSGAEVEKRYVEIVEWVRSAVHIPIAVKLNPYFSNMGKVASDLSYAGANGLTLFNRFYQPDMDIYSLKLMHNLHYSEAAEIRLPLLWIALLSGQLKCSLAASTGVQSAAEVIKYLLAGANVTMTASALYKKGISYLKTMNLELQAWMKEMGFQSVDTFRGVMNHYNIQDPSAYERANYIKILESNKVSRSKY
ncbi:MAG TPA: dihydroorotate dehydrogenase-like protein [Saprospiraceae bacterium]|nr:dihydroorotate dehydrogenase-like protein [Saprospiraceae bacterium]HRG19722.1 dihydroorotate dehydrogenase-like protein [Saprospiraceae bacterium]HRG65421.1 dihydroorotate dehydrogenase-like protein [Saprospiraceae bacterium]